MSLSAAPLAKAPDSLDGDSDQQVLQKLLDFLGKTLEPYYGFQSLFAFKQKFQSRAPPDVPGVPRLDGPRRDRGGGGPGLHARRRPCGTGPRRAGRCSSPTRHRWPPLTEPAKAPTPFELQSSIVAAARASGRPVLDAGRGQPNWVATIPRAGYLALATFAINAAANAGDVDGRGRAPETAGLANRLHETLAGPIKAGSKGSTFLAEAVAYGIDELGFEPDAWVGELTTAILGAGYPSPTRMLVHLEQVAERYMTTVMNTPPAPIGTYKVFATEGGAAAMAYVFNTLRENHVISAGDAIAMATPIFTPYLQIPVLEDFGFRVVEIQASHNTDHRFEDHALDKLLDPSIKAFFVINPGNPDSRAITPERMRELHDLVVAQRPDLVIVADTAYAAFIDGFRGTIGHLPRNVICIHSYSKTFGATGNRLGFVAVHGENVLDDLLRAQSPEVRRAARERYRSVTSDADSMPFVDRLVADSRDVALHNIAGLATPDQVQMGLFSLYHLLPSGQAYIEGIRTELGAREHALLDPLGIDAPGGEDSLYYALVDTMQVIRLRHGDRAEAIAEAIEPWQIARRLADQHGVVVLPGQLFDADSWDVRISLASLTIAELEQVGTAMSTVIDELTDDL